jgi:hypothetical protein
VFKNNDIATVRNAAGWCADRSRRLQQHAPARAANSAARPLEKCCPVAQAIACSHILALEITFRNKITGVGVLRRPALITSFGHGHGCLPRSTT